MVVVCAIPSYVWWDVTSGMCDVYACIANIGGLVVMNRVVGHTLEAHRVVDVGDRMAMHAMWECRTE